MNHGSPAPRNHHPSSHAFLLVARVAKPIRPSPTCPHPPLDRHRRSEINIVVSETLKHDRAETRTRRMNIFDPSRFSSLHPFPPSPTTSVSRFGFSRKNSRRANASLKKEQDPLIAPCHRSGKRINPVVSTGGIKIDRDKNMKFDRFSPLKSNENR